MALQLQIGKINKPSVCVLGGSGFVGKHLVSELAAAGYHVRVPTRRRERHRELLVLPRVEVIQTDIHDTALLRQVLAGCDVVINLVAILNERRRGDFETVHVKLPRNILHACEDQGITRLLHMSALNADPSAGKSRYLRTKGQGEALVHAAEGMRVTSFRPSIVFGPGDHFFRRFAVLLRRAPGIFPLACPQARFAPVYVGDVVRALLVALENPLTVGERYELCGPHSYSLQELVDFTAQTLNLSRAVIGLGSGLSRLQAAVLGHMPGKLFTHDNFLSLQVNCVCTGTFPPIFRVRPQALEGLVPLYLAHGDLRGRYDEFRRHTPHQY
jgi:NADH dehydrogenase